MTKPTDPPRQQWCFVPSCKDHPSWLRPVTERRSYPAGQRGRVAA